MVKSNKVSRLVSARHPCRRAKMSCCQKSGCGALPFIQIATRESECPDWQELKTKLAPKNRTPVIFWYFDTKSALGLGRAPRKEARPRRTDRERKRPTWNAWSVGAQMRRSISAYISKERSQRPPSHHNARGAPIPPLVPPAPGLLRAWLGLPWAAGNASLGWPRTPLNGTCAESEHAELISAYLLFGCDVISVVGHFQEVEAPAEPLSQPAATASAPATDSFWFL